MTHSRSIDTATLVDYNFTEWYDKGLPPQLAYALEHEPADIAQALQLKPFANFRTTLQKSLVKAEVPNAPCHGNIHASRVVFRAQQALEMVQSITEGALPVGLMQHALIGYARHDWMHPATSFHALQDSRQLQALPTGLSGSHADYSVEYVTSVWVDAQNAVDSVNVVSRLLQTYITWASTIGGTTALGRELKLDVIKPQGFLGLLMRAVDITPTSDFVYNTAFETDLFCIERGMTEMPSDSATYITSRHGFLKHIRETYEALDHATRTVCQGVGILPTFSLTERLGWGELLRSAEADLTALECGDDVRWAMLNSMLQLRDTATL
jgi:hypothetical protein